MARYRYVAQNMEGKTSRGVLEAAGEPALQQLLREQGLYLVKARDVSASRSRKRIPTRQLGEFCRELSNLLGAGVSIVRALDIIAHEDGITEAAREVYLDMLADIKRGISLSEAMEHTEAFPDLMLGMIRSGEGSGNIDLVADRLAKHYSKEHKLNQQVRSSMMYPAVLLFMCVAVVLLIVTFILPQFESLFAQMESLPMPTVILMGASDFLVQKWYVALFAVVVCVTAVRVISGFYGVRMRLDRCKVHFPIVGRLNKIIYTARFARTLSSLYSSGMPIVGALKTAGETIGNRYVEQQFDEVSRQVRSGVPLSQALSQVDGLQKKLASTILVGEESGRLDVMLDSIAETMEAEAEQATKRLATLLEPVLICLMALLVGFIMVAVMLPIYQSYGAIEGAA